MRLTPLDIHNHRFGRRFSGYDREEVDSFLRVVGEDYESLVQETNALHETIRRLEGRIDEVTADEKVLKEAIVSAQSVCDELRHTAVKEAELMIGAAEVRAEKILEASNRRAARLAEDIREMKLLRTRLAAAVRSTIETHLHLLEGLAEDPTRDPKLEEKVRYLANHAGARAHDTA